MRYFIAISIIVVFGSAAFAQDNYINKPVGYNYGSAPAQTSYNINSGIMIDNTYHKWNNSTQSYTTYTRNGNNIYGSDGTTYYDYGGFVQSSTGQTYQVTGNLIQKLP